MLQPSDLPSETIVAATVPSARRSADGPPVLWELLNDVQDGTVLSDEDGTIVLATRRAAEMFGYQAAELAGRPVGTLLPAARLGRRRDGTVFPVEISLSPVTIAGGRFTFTTIRDVAQGLRLGSLVGLPAAARSAERG